MSDQRCRVRGCGAQVLDAFVCQDCTYQLAEDLRLVIAGQQRESTVRNVGAHEDYYTTGQPIRRPVQTGVRGGAPVVVDEIRPGDFARVPSSPFDHDSSLFTELLAAYARQTRTGRGGVASETPVVWHEKAGELRREFAATLVRYARLVADARSISLPDDANLLTLATWLERHVRWLRQQETGGGAVTEIHRQVAAILTIVDPVDDRQFIGLCTAKPIAGDGCQCCCHVDRTILRRGAQRPLCDRITCTHKGALCGTSLHADVHDVEVSCPVCRQLFNVDAHRQWLLDKLGTVLATATEISTALTSLDQPVTPERIRKWKQRSLLVVRGYRRRDGASAEDAGDPVYLLGDVIALRDKAEAAAARRDARKAG